MNKDLELLKELCMKISVSGNEKAVRELIIREIKNYCEYEVDNTGNIIAFKKGRNKAKNKTMIASHMDEVGFIITGINEDGTLKFSAVGGIDERILPSSKVIINDNILGTIAEVPIHLVPGEEKGKFSDADKLTIDIGAKNKEEAENAVSLGDIVSFKPNFEFFGEDLIKAKALDDRIGCFILIDLIKSDLKYDMYFAFTVQEEIGLRGAKTAAYKINPDYAIVIEATTAADIAGVPYESQICNLGNGAAVSFMDGRTIYDKTLYELAFKLAKENEIMIQQKRGISGGNDAGAIHQSRDGVPTAAISLPCRYLHSPACVICEDDIDSVKSLALKLSERIAGGL